MLWEVEVLVHLNRRVRVEAASAEDAMGQARLAGEDWYPDAALVDAVDAEEVEE